MRKAEGFLTDDGAFFEHQSDARLHESKVKLLEAFNCSIHVPPGMTFMQYIKLLQALQHPTSAYLSALAIATAEETTNKDEESDEPKAGPPPKDRGSDANKTETPVRSKGRETS